MENLTLNLFSTCHLNGGGTAALSGAKVTKETDVAKMVADVKAEFGCLPAVGQTTCSRRQLQSSNQPSSR